MWRPDRYAELRSFLRRSRVEDEVEEELRLHLQMRFADNMAEGMDSAAAWDDAVRRFGNMERIRQETSSIDRSAIREERRMELIGTLRREANHAFRTLLRNPSFSAVAILTLGLGLGGTTALFALLDSVVLNPLSYSQPDRLAFVSSSVPNLSQDDEWGVSPAGYFHFLKNQRSFASMGAYAETEMPVVAGGPAEKVSVGLVTSSLMAVLDASAARGRLFTPEEDAPDAPAVAILSHAYWSGRFGGRAEAVGTSIRITGKPYLVVGVLPRGFQLPDRSADVFLPLGLDPAAEFVNEHHLSVVGRLRSGVSMASARAELTQLTSQLEQAYPDVYSESFMEQAGFATKSVLLRDHVIGDIGRVLWILLAGVGMVLLIACANVANLFLVRTESRQRELALRAALGAERLQLAMHYVFESVVMCLIAAGLALFLAQGALRVLVHLAPTGIPRLQEVGLGARSIAFALCCATLAGISFGLFPLLRRTGGYEALREGGRGVRGSQRSNAARSVLAVTQVALALLLLGGAGLMLRSFNALRAVDPGVRPAGVLTLEVPLPDKFDSAEKRQQFYRDLATRIRGLPGVLDVGTGNYVPLRAPDGCTLVFFEGRPLGAGEHAPCSFVAVATPGYFEALGMRVRGRSLAWSDVDTRSDAVLVSEAFAKRYWPNEDAIGKGFGPNSESGPYYHVVGVVENTRKGRVDEPEVEGMFYQMRKLDGGGVWSGSGAMTVAVKTALADPLSLVPSIRGIVSELDGDVPIANPRTLGSIVAASMQRTSFTALLLGVAAVMSLLLSAVGLYGVISHIAGQRRGEMAVRLALGASVSTVGGIVLKQSLRLAAVGVAIGLVASIGSSALLRSLLYGVQPMDGATLGIVSLTLILVALVAAWVPAMRAARLQPMQVLRED